jgi:hypothetical protein
MHVVPNRPTAPFTVDTGTDRPPATRHAWVAATLVGMGEGDTRRAEHAARTGRHVLRAATKVEVLEVYCRRCRVPYSDRRCDAPCTAAAVRFAS